MTYRAKVDVWLVAAILLAMGAVLAGADRWIVTPMLVILMMCAYPESYRTGPAGLEVCGVLSRRVVPYERIRFVGATGCGVRVDCRPGWEFVSLRRTGMLSWRTWPSAHRICCAAESAWWRPWRDRDLA